MESNQNGTVFKISGVRVDVSSGIDDDLPPSTESILHNIATSEDSTSSSPTLRVLELKCERSTPSLSSDGSGEDTNVNIDALLEDLEDHDIINDESVGEKLNSIFQISVNDMDTGLNYDIPFVKCLQLRQNRYKKSREDVCKLWQSNHNGGAEKFKFASTKRVHGDRAEIVLNKQFGPRYCGQKYLVYKGEMAFAYKYPLCFPKTDVTDTKWCL